MARNRLFTNSWQRRGLLAGAAALFAVLSVFPQQYRAVVTLSPTDAASLGLGGALGQLGAFSSVFGNQAATEISLRVARSLAVRKMVAKEVDLMRRKGFSDTTEADRWLTTAVDIRALRGGIIQMDSKGNDPEFRQQLVGAFADATRFRMAEIARTQTATKREVLTKLVDGAADRVNRAQAAYDSYRRQSRYSEPGNAISAIGARVESLQETLKQREIELDKARAFATDDNMSVRQIITEMNVLRQQLAEAKSLDARQPYSVNRVVIETTRIQKLERELQIAKGLYESYKRFLEGTAVEDLAATANTRVLEPPFVDTARQFRAIPVALLLIIILVALSIELYLLRPPVGAFRDEDVELRR